MSEKLDSDIELLKVINEVDEELHDYIEVLKEAAGEVQVENFSPATSPAVDEAQPEMPEPIKDDETKP